MYQPHGRCFTRKVVLVPGKLLTNVGARRRFATRTRRATLKLTRAEVQDIATRELSAAVYAAIYRVSVQTIYNVWGATK